MQPRVIRWFIMAGLAVAAGPALAQATAVQLPTYSFFSVDTTVSVPDSGSGFLGGMSQSQDSQNQFGFPLPLFGNRSIGSSRTAAGARVTATIHNFAAMDEALLGEPASSFAEHHRPGRRGQCPGARPGRPGGKLAAARARQETESEAAAAVAAEAVRRAALRQTRADEAREVLRPCPSGRDRRQVQGRPHLLPDGRPSRIGRIEAAGAGSAASDQQCVGDEGRRDPPVALFHRQPVGWQAPATETNDTLPTMRPRVP